VIGPLKTPWTQLKGRASLEGRALRFHDVTGAFGSGMLTLSGALALAGARPRSADLKLALRKFALAPQPRFDIALDADSTLKWTAGDALPVLGGQVTLTRMHYARHVQLPEAVIALGRKSKDASEPTVAVDVLVGHRAPLTVRNDFLDVELEMAGKDKAIRVVGTDAQLGAVGELSVLRGRALFRGATLTVRRGVISFKSEKSVVPALDLLADAPAKRRPGGLIHFEAKGDPSRFDLQLHCQADGAVPPPFTCAYAGADMTCGNFAELTALWACQTP
jgi:autotransporter translocation and assembly factor TamB